MNIQNLCPSSMFTQGAIRFPHQQRPDVAGQIEQGYQHGVLVFEPYSSTYWWQDKETKKLVYRATQEEINRARRGDWSTVPFFKYRGFIEKKTRAASISAWYEVGMVSSTNFSALNHTTSIQPESSRQSDMSSTNSAMKPSGSWQYDQSSSSSQQPAIKRKRTGSSPGFDKERWTTDTSNKDKKDTSQTNSEQIDKLKKEHEVTLKTLSMTSMTCSFSKIESQLSVERAVNEDVVAELKKQLNSSKKELSRLKAENLELRDKHKCKHSQSEGVQTEQELPSIKKRSNQMNITRKTTSQRLQKINELKKKNVSVQQKLTDAQKTEQESQKKIKEFEKQTVAVQRKLTDAQKAEQESEKKIKELEKQNVAVQRKLTDAQKAEQESEKKIKELEKQTVAVQRKLTDAQKTEQESGKKIKELEKQNVAVQQKLTDAQKTEQESENKIKALEKQNVAIQWKLTDAQKAEQKSGKKMKELEKQSVSVQQKLTDAQKTEQESGKKIKELEKQNVAVQQKLTDAQQTEQESGKKIKELEKQNVSVQLKLTDAQKTEQESENKIKELEKQRFDAVSDLKLKLQLSLNELNEMKGESLRLTKSNSCEQSQSKGIQTDLHEIKEDLSESNVQMAQVQNENSISKQRIAHLLVSLQSKDERLIEKQNELAELETRLHSANSAVFGSTNQ